MRAYILFYTNFSGNDYVPKIFLDRAKAEAYRDKLFHERTDIIDIIIGEWDVEK